MLTGKEKATLIWREGNGIFWETVSLQEIESNQLEAIANYKQISFDSDEVWFDRNMNLCIGERDTDYYADYTGELLMLIKMAFVADVLFKQGKSRQEVVNYLSQIQSQLCKPFSLI
ncbi:hypothetical protein PN456_19195 [Nodularia spumigena CS-586/05]|uniref:hypothetical protein n=1 Tax=Nodularia spumigena TaxID=70799 RepID=UPI00232B8A77|nr:hypothetical protein [Nodularia spumigena]MDB9371046.1 hypothetical protein [Nodularia spumigena CS-586/05]